MASLSKDPSGLYTIQICGADGKRRSIRTGFTNKKTANEVKLKVEHLHTLTVAKLPMDAESAAWVAGIGDELAEKLAAVGLVPARESRNLGEFLVAYLERRKADSKPNTITNIHRVIKDLIAFYGTECPIRSVTVEKAEAFKAYYVAKGLAPGTIYRQLKWAKFFLGWRKR